ncbi:MAG: segregation/condensation protein A [bacterium]
MPDIKLEKFSGPLDLLLQLIDQHELDITEISLSQITGQYFQYLDRLEKNRSEKLADFLVIAAKLIYLKSKNLLPQLCADEEQESDSLAEQLKMYKAYVDASQHIQSRWSCNKISYTRIEPPTKMKEFTAPSNARIEDLHKSFEDLLARLKPVKPLPEATIDHAVSVKQVVDKIRKLLEKNKSISFKSLFEQTKNRSEVIVSFLALLELIGKDHIIVRQADSFSDFEVAKNN